MKGLSTMSISPPPTPPSYWGSRTKELYVRHLSTQGTPSDCDSWSSALQDEETEKKESEENKQESDLEEASESTEEHFLRLEEQYRIHRRKAQQWDSSESSEE